MENAKLYEEYYNKYIKNLNYWLPEGIIEVDIELLQRFDLLGFFNNKIKGEDTLTRYFQVMESEEKITLANNQFVIWIVPDNLDEIPTTYTFIALKSQIEPHLELAFSTSGVYNTSRLVLRVLEKYLIDIQENEELLKKIEKVS